MRNFITMIICCALAIGIVVFFPFNDSSFKQPISSKQAKVEQKTEILDEIHSVYHLYHQSQYIGTLMDKTILDRHLKQIYQQRYAAEFPNTSVEVGEDVYLVKEETYLSYENKDQEILNYLDQNDLFALKATAISFQDDGGEYAKIYVVNEEIYNEALNEYLSYFIDPATIEQLKNSNISQELTTYGTMDTGYQVLQKILIGTGYAKPANIKKTKDEVLQYLEYGDNQQREYYTVKEFDTVAGVGAKNYGLSAKQIMDINHDVIHDVNQALTVGQQLCITYFTSPIDVVVYKKALRKEPIYFDTAYIEDATIEKGNSVVRQVGTNGLKNSLFTEKWVNGILLEGVENSSVILQDAINSIVAIGTGQPTNVGTGSYRYPVDDARISCPWGCYFGHRGTDFVNQYDPWGDVYAADNGTIEEVSYNSVNGNYVIINHNNGMRSYYGHLRVKSSLPIGTVVKKGDVIGHIGMTGFATGPHVHFFFEQGDQRVDACQILDCEGLY